MTALITVACIYTRAYKTVANVTPRAKRRFNVGAVMRINVYGVIGIFFFGGFNKLSYNVVPPAAAFSFAVILKIKCILSKELNVSCGILQKYRQIQ